MFVGLLPTLEVVGLDLDERERVACAATDRVGVTGDGQLAVRDDDGVVEHAAGAVGACKPPLHLQEVCCFLANVQLRALGSVPVARVRGKVDSDPVRAVRHSERPRGGAADALAVAIEVVHAVGLARRRTAAGGEVDIRVAVAVPAVTEVGVAADGEARAVVEDGRGNITEAVGVSRFRAVPTGTRAGV